MNQTDVTANRLLRAARERQRSPSGSGRRLSRQELADAVNAYIWEQHRRRTNVDANYVGKLERGHHRWPHAMYREAFRAVLGAQVDAELGFYIVRTSATDQTDHVPAAAPEADRQPGHQHGPQPGQHPEDQQELGQELRQGLEQRTNGDSWAEGQLRVNHQLAPSARRAEAVPVRVVAPGTSNVAAAASAIRDNALGYAAASLSPERLARVETEVRRLAHDFADTPPRTLSERLLSAHGAVGSLLARTMRPAQLSALHQAAGQLTGLAAIAVLDLGFPDAAGDLAQAAYTHGDIVPHGPLRAWARGVQATVAFWAGRPRDALGYVASGLQDATGPATVRLHAIAARAWAAQGAREQALAELNDAFSARDRYGGADEYGAEFGAEFGGEFVFGPARLSLCAAAVMLTLGEGGLASEHAAEALKLLQQAPYGQRRWTSEHGATVDLATARVLQGELEGAVEAVGACRGLEPDRRTARLTLRLCALREAVERRRYLSAAAARHITGAIDEFVADAYVLPSRSGFGVPAGSLMGPYGPDTSTAGKASA